MRWPRHCKAFLQPRPLVLLAFGCSTCGRLVGQVGETASLCSWLVWWRCWRLAVLAVMLLRFWLVPTWLPSPSHRVASAPLPLGRFCGGWPASACWSLCGRMLGEPSSQHRSGWLCLPALRQLFTALVHGMSAMQGLSTKCWSSWTSKTLSTQCPAKRCSAPLAPNFRLWLDGCNGVMVGALLCSLAPLPFTRRQGSSRVIPLAHCCLQPLCSRWRLNSAKGALGPRHVLPWWWSRGWWSSCGGRGFGSRAAKGSCRRLRPQPLQVRGGGAWQRDCCRPFHSFTRCLALGWQWCWPSPPQLQVPGSCHRQWCLRGSPHGHTGGQNNSPPRSHSWARRSPGGSPSPPC